MLELRGATSNYIPQLLKSIPMHDWLPANFTDRSISPALNEIAIRLPLPNAFVIFDFSKFKAGCIIDLPVFLSDVTPIGLQAYSHTVSVYYCTQKEKIKPFCTFWWEHGKSSMGYTSAVLVKRKCEKMKSQPKPRNTIHNERA